MRLGPIACAVSVAATFLFALALPSAGQQAPQPEVVAAAARSGPVSVTGIAAGPAIPGAHPLTAEDVNAWLDGFMPDALERSDIAGAVLIIVKDGQVLTQRGYGYDNLETRRPMDPERTLMRPGSVSKLFTWTAVMQLVEQGRLDLDADVNAYLDFQIPGPPITLRNLLQHTPGFEDSIKNIATETETGVTLAERVRWIPPRIFAPGTTPAYSNYGTGLAGYIVERVSGESYEDYVDTHILQPLGMNRSTMHQPLPQHLQADMALGYRTASSGRQGHFDLVGIAPAGALSATAADMGRFMIAYLQGGAIGDARILRPETVQLMQTTEYEGVPNLNHMVLGFYQRSINGHRVIGHEGDLNDFHSNLLLFPDQNLGIFLSVNSMGGAGGAYGLRGAMYENFADRYLPGPVPDGEVDEATAREHARMMAGLYEYSRRWQHGILSGLSLLGQTTITATPDGSISVSGMSGRNGATTRWKEIAPFVWREVDGHWRLAAQVENGRVVRFAVDTNPTAVADRVPWHRSSALIVPLLMGSLGLLAVTALFWPVIAVVRWRYKQPFAFSGREAWGYRAARVAAILVLGTFIVWTMMLPPMFSPISDAASNKSDGTIFALHVASLIALVAAALMALWNAFLAWTHKRSWWSKLWNTLLVLACLGAITCAAAFGLIGFDPNY